MCMLYMQMYMCVHLREGELPRVVQTGAARLGVVPAVCPAPPLAEGAAVARVVHWRRGRRGCFVSMATATGREARSGWAYHMERVKGTHDTAHVEWCNANGGIRRAAYLSLIHI